MSDPLSALEAWYLSNCNGDWEHSNGVSIGTLDNPGWSLRIDLADTPLAGRPFDRAETDRSEHDWVVCWLEDQQFNATCGPRNLREALSTFLRGAE